VAEGKKEDGGLWIEGKTHEENAEKRRTENGGLNITIVNGFGTEADPIKTF
jgi:hypothetical protein